MYDRKYFIDHGMKQVVLKKAGNNDLLNKHLNQVFWVREFNCNTSYAYYNLYDNKDQYMGWTRTKNCVPYSPDPKELIHKIKIRTIRCL